jgi:glycosyltransferase involved in cell wall biosynthesis
VKKQPYKKIFWVGVWPRTGYVNARYHELFRRFTNLRQVRLPFRRGVWRLEPLFAALLSRRNRWLLCTRPSLARFWRGSVIADVDDPNFSESEIAQLNHPSVEVVVTTTERLKSQFIESGLTKPVAVVPSGFSGGDWDSRLVEEIANSHNPEGFPVVGYAGSTVTLSLNEDDPGNVSLLAHAMEKVWSEAPDTQLWLIGDATPRVYRWSDGRPGVKVFGHIPRNALLNYLKNFTVATFPRRVDLKGLFSVKLIEYMGMGLPIVASSVTETEIVEKARAGVRVSTVEEFARSLLMMLGDEPLRLELGKNAMKFARPYEWDLVAARYEDDVLRKYCGHLNGSRNPLRRAGSANRGSQ